MTNSERESIINPLIKKKQLLVILELRAQDNIPQKMHAIGKIGKIHSYTTLRKNNNHVRFVFNTPSPFGDSIVYLHDVIFGIVHSVDDLDSIKEEISVHRGTDEEHASDKILKIDVDLTGEAIVDEITADVMKGLKNSIPAKLVYLKNREERISRSGATVWKKDYLKSLSTEITQNPDTGSITDSLITVRRHYPDESRMSDILYMGKDLIEAIKIFNS